MYNVNEFRCAVNCTQDHFRCVMIYNCSAHLKNSVLDLFCAYKFKFWGADSGVARAFPGGQVAHPEGQNEDEN